MALFFLNQQPILPSVQLRGALFQRAINVPVLLVGTVRRQIVGTVTVPYALGQRYTISGTVTVPVELRAILGATTSGAGANLVTYNTSIEVPVVLSEKAGIGALVSGGAGSNKIEVPYSLRQTFSLTGTVGVTHANTGTVSNVGNLRSPALVHFDGTNFIKRTAGTGPGDNDLSGKAAFTAVVVFDPELISVGQNCTVVAKDDGATQRAWRVEWASATGLVTVTVCSLADGTIRSSRVTTTAIRTRSALGFTWDSTSLRLFVNGVSSEGVQSDVGIPGAMATSTEPLSVGAHNPTGGGTAPMIGAVYMLAVFDVVLSGTDIAKVRRDGSIAHDVLALSSLKALWHPDQIQSNYTHAQFYTWKDQKNLLDLAPAFISGGVLPYIIPSDALAPLTRRNDWNISFQDTGIRPQNLTSTYALSTSQPIRRLYTGIATQPNIASGSNWRRFKNDLTFIVYGYKTVGTNSVVLVRCYGFELLWDRPTLTLLANVGVDTTLTLQNARYTFGVGTIPGLGEASAFAAVVRYNASDDKLDVFIGSEKYTVTPTTTSVFSDSAALLVSDQMDYIRAIAIPACLPDAAVFQVLTGLNGTPYSMEIGQSLRYVPQGVQEGLSFAYPEYTLQFPTDPDPPPAVVPFSLDQITQIAILPPSVQDLIEPYDFPYLDTPYPVREAETIDDDETAQTIFGDPLPSIVSVTADVGHNVVAVVNAGPTDAGEVISWWEVEYVSGGTETFVQIDYNGSNDFSTNRNHTDTFAIAPGLDFRDKRIRFVIQAVLDGSQIWKSLYVRMEDTAAFNNATVQTIIIAGPTQPSPPTITDLEITLTQQALVLKRQAEARNLTLQIGSESRYKLTRPFIDDEQEIGVEFELMSKLDDFYRVGRDFRIHRVRSSDLGFLDRLAVDYYGPGNEKLWWAIAYANAIVDPEIDMQVGQALLVPSVATVQRFLARRPTR